MGETQRKTHEQPRGKTVRRESPQRTTNDKEKRDVRGFSRETVVRWRRSRGGNNQERRLSQVSAKPISKA